MVGILLLMEKITTNTNNLNNTLVKFNNAINNKLRYERLETFWHKTTCIS